jgi:hypothetical protein
MASRIRRTNFQGKPIMPQYRVIAHVPGYKDRTIVVHAEDQEAARQLVNGYRAPKGALAPAPNVAPYLLGASDELSSIDEIAD